jgi:hypothetical protein
VCSRVIKKRGGTAGLTDKIRRKEGDWRSGVYERLITR